MFFDHTTGPTRCWVHTTRAFLSGDTTLITIWHNRQTNAPSLEVGTIKYDFPLEEPNEPMRPAADALFTAVMQHPDVVSEGNQIKGPVTQEIGDLIMAALREEVNRFAPKVKKRRMASEVSVEIS